MAQTSQSDRQAPALSRRERFFAGYLWLILKNLLGWTLILLSLVAGPLIPGPGGIPLFLIGFALVTFPGKRRLTARVLRGIIARPGTRGYRVGSAVVAVLLPAAVSVYLATLAPAPVRRVFAGAAPRTTGLVAAAYVGAALAIGFAAPHAAGLLNWVLGLAPRTRRKVRPWLRRHGIDLLP